MGTDQTGTYQQAKEVFNSLLLHECIVINTKHKSIFRKHLVEMQKRQHSVKRFATRNTNKNTIKITRIE